MEEVSQNKEPTGASPPQRVTQPADIDPGRQSTQDLHERRSQIRGFGVRVPGGAPAKTCPDGTQSWNQRPLPRYSGRIPGPGTGHIERLPNGSYRVHMYAGTDPLTGRRLRYRKTVRTKGRRRSSLTGC
jgi:hypothetical protein